uniref:Uncharacterized protein n=1 Tax=Chromera velia CCMP2878 TaxID=1169474 RepID=A0A0G4G0M7_9ALVE|eukprot:Cvel_19686.t1-p1 / transcript=Cvel_19686.t1 / gene=Cvel_19686 / organism=Chromera_velia_CCMP2878 / gene_product=hypothetical protein / transcript_product=hypothetical protein / location=Cvel_scaffold1717:20444-22662(-) / protein_length=156 / sequence_SO=supercontig / SO=protein_coding / is_pseudo=false
MPGEEAATAENGRPIVVPGTKYVLGSTLQIAEHKFVLTDVQDRLQAYAQPGVPMALITEHRGTWFFAPYNNMALGLVQMSLNLERDKVVPHYWMYEPEYDEILQRQQGGGMDANGQIQAPPLNAGGGAQGQGGGEDPGAQGGGESGTALEGGQTSS